MKGLTAFLIISLVLPGSAVAASIFDDALVGGETESLAMNLGVGDYCWAAGIAAGITAKALDGGEQGSGYANAHSPFVAGMESFLLPGLGQYFMGHDLRSKVYFGLEGAAWIAIGTFAMQGYARENAYKDYAVVLAGVNGTDHSDDYYEIIGDYMSSDGPGSYNEYVMREARDLYYPDRELMDDYYEAHKMSGDMSWRWRSETAFTNYNSLYDGSRSAYRRALYTVMLALTLRVVSTVDAVRLAMGKDMRSNDAGGKVSIGFEQRPGGFSLSVKRSF